MATKNLKLISFAVSFSLVTKLIWDPLSRKHTLLLDKMI